MTPTAAMVADLELLHRAARGDDAADDLVTGDHGIYGIAPFVAGHVKVRVADAAEEDFNGNFSGAGLAAREVERSERRLGILCSKTL